ncbi:Vacuolar protein sorting-associated protein 11 [Podosphaera aphanis]|nr:Vacuolar protein sorting-associated protein 11 [Podosphaera aphanis]
MALTSWKIFDFFEVSQVNPADDESKSFFESNQISCICTGSENLFVGSNDGSVRIVSSEFKVLQTFQAGKSCAITYMKEIERSSILVTVSETISSEPVLKVWAMDKLDKKTGQPTCLSTLSVQNSRKIFPITAFTAVDDLSQLAFGFGNGSVTVIRGDLVHDRGAKQRTIFDSEEPITGLELRDEYLVPTLYIATTSRVLKLIISARGQSNLVKTVEDAGCALGCMTFDKKNGDIVVVRDDAIYYYGVDGRGPCYAYDGPKSMVTVYKDYITLASPPGAASKSVRGSNLLRLGGAQADEIFNTSTFTILDTGLKFIAHSESLVSQVKIQFIIWGSLFTLMQNGKIYRYNEKPLQQRLENLYQRNLFVSAISLAQKSGVDDSQLNIIFRKYGDFLYQKADYDGAMQQYLKAIDNTEPSQVIRKFLDTQRIHNLIEFLEELHEKLKANSDHTTLLLNCYAKLKDVQKLEKFIKSPGDLKFDLDTAVSMCRQGGYYEQAAYLAEKHGDNELVVDILIEDSKMYDAAIQYISRLDPEAAYVNLMKYARVLLEHCPQETTQLFIQFFTGHFSPMKDNVNSPILQQQQSSYAAGAVSAVQNLKDLFPLPYMNTSALAQNNAETTPSNNLMSTGSPEISVSQYTPPPSRKAFSSFVDHPDEFISFLEACSREKDLNEQDKTDLHTALFEMYLLKSREKKGIDKEQWEVKAKKLIENKEIPIDTSNVLLLSHLSDFRDGTVLVREQAGLRFDIFRSYTLAKDTRGAIKALKKYGPEEPQLYPAALAFFTSDAKVLEEAGDELDAVLMKIDEDGLMAPLQIIQTLSTNAFATMGMVKNYLHQVIERERNEIAMNRQLIDSYRSETIEKRKEISDLSTKPQTFNNTRCHFCGSQLSLPTIHFLCKHSFHQTCLNVDIGKDGSIEGSCPSCRKDMDTIRAIRKAQDDSSDRHDMFLDALERSMDRFSTISEFFGRGVMNVAPLD